MSDELNVNEQETDGVTPAGSYERSDKGARKRSRAIRLGVLITGLVIITAIGLIHQMGPIKVVGVDALCPFGGIETLWALITGVGFVKKIAASSLILLGVTVVLAVIFRRSFCGLICPLGALQELFGKVGKAIWRGNKRPEIPAAIDRPARWLKYVVLAVFTLWTWQAAELVIRPYDPWVAYMHLTSAEVFAEFSIGLAILGVSLAGSMIYERFFCKYLCPMGGFLGAISRFSFFKVRRNADTCIDCKACDKVCPVNIKVSEVPETVQSPECINCNECVNACPVKDTLEVSTKPLAQGGKVMSAQNVLFSVVGIIAALLVATTVSGSFSWTLPGITTLPATTEPGATETPAIDLESIRGSMTIAEVALATGIAEAAFQEKWGIAPEDMGLKIKDLGVKYGFDVHTDFRDFVEEQLNAAKPESAAPTGGAAAAAAGTAVEGSATAPAEVGGIPMGAASED